MKLHENSCPWTFVKLLTQRIRKCINTCNFLKNYFYFLPFESPYCCESKGVQFQIDLKASVRNVFLKSIYYKRLGFWIFALQESNTFAEIIEKKFGQAWDLNLWQVRSEVDHANHYTMEISISRLKVYYFFTGQKFKMHVSYNE